jgi:hypothetical protein
VVTAGAPAGVFLAFASAAHAAGKEITRTGTYTTSRGGSGTMSSVTTRSNGVVSTQGTWTNASGATGTSQSQATWNKSTQTAAVSGSVTKPNGSASSWQGTDVRTAPGTITGSGTQATYSMTDTKVAPGTWDKSEVVTNANGTTVDHNVTTTVSGTSGTRAATTTLPNGRTETRTTTFTQTVTPLPAPGN